MESLLLFHHHRGNGSGMGDSPARGSAIFTGNSGAAGEESFVEAGIGERL